MQESELEVEDDLAFAAGLAADWGFVELAGQVLERIEQQAVAHGARERIGVARCELYAQAALAERDRTLRNELFEQAVSEYERFLANTTDPEAAEAARVRYLDTCSAFARSLEIAMEAAVGEEAEALRQRRGEVLVTGIRSTGTLLESQDSVPEPSEAQKRERAGVMLIRGRLLLELGRTQQVGEFPFQQAHQILEEVCFDRGGDSPDALRAYDLIGRVYRAQGDPEQAAIYFQAVIEQVLPSDPEAWATLVGQLSPSDKEQRWLFVELSTGGLCESLMAAGDVAGACRYALHLYNTQKREGFSYSTTLGYPSLLVAARTLLDSGGVIGGNLAWGEASWYATEADAADAGVKKRARRRATELALTIAQQVIGENRDNVLRLHGQKLIAELAGRPGVVVDPRDLYSAAEGHYDLGELELALAGFRLVLEAVQGGDRTVQLELVPKTLFRMGRAHQRLDRHLEACVAFREGCQQWSGDPEYDAPNARAFYDSARILRRQAPGDDTVEALFEEAEGYAVSSEHGSAGEILVRLAEKKQTVEGDLEGAIALYRQVGRGDPHHEKALVGIGVCEFLQGKQDEAYQIFVDYLEVFVTDPLNTTAGNAARQARRRGATAVAGYYRVVIEYERGEYEQVIEHARDYHETHREQESFAPRTLRMLGNSLFETGQLEEAKSLLRTALERYPENRQVAAFAIELYKALQRRHEAEDDDPPRKILREMAELLAIGNEAALTASFDNLRRESKHWIDLGEWEKAREKLEGLTAHFGEDPRYRADCVSYVLPDLGHVLLELHRSSEALAILSDLVSHEEKKPSKQTLLDYTRAVTGWLEGDAAHIRIVPGAGTTADELRDVVLKLSSMADGVDQKWTCEWYELKFRLAYAYHVWATAEGGPRDSRKRDIARTQLDALVQELGSEFRGSSEVPGVGRKCDEDDERADTLGSEILRRRLVWLWKKVD